jgi:hypothetical protein
MRNLFNVSTGKQPQVRACYPELVDPLTLAAFAISPSMKFIFMRNFSSTSNAFNPPSCPRQPRPAHDG